MGRIKEPNTRKEKDSWKQWNLGYFMPTFQAEKPATLVFLRISTAVWTKTIHLDECSEILPAQSHVKNTISSTFCKLRMSQVLFESTFSHSSVLFFTPAFYDFQVRNLSNKISCQLWHHIKQEETIWSSTQKNNECKVTFKTHLHQKVGRWGCHKYFLGLI